jgi:H+-transporting ATPase
MTTTRVRVTARTHRSPCHVRSTRDDTKHTIDDAIAKEIGRRLGLSDRMYPANILKDAPAPGGKHLTRDEMIVDADGFAGVFPEHLEHKYEIVKCLQCLGHL